MSDLYEYAVEFATMAHRGQVRRYTGEPYIMHPLAVSAFVEWYGGDDTQRIAAILHDVVEDTPFNMDSIRRRFGPDVTELVHQLTDQYTKARFPAMNRAERKHAERLRWNRPAEGAALVKVCDLMHNARSIRLHDPDFWVVFQREAIDMVMKLESILAAPERQACRDAMDELTLIPRRKA